MDTMRVEICYRPLRIAWAVKSGDLDAFRIAVKYSNVLWGGTFNPIIPVDQEEQARRWIDLFRVDVIEPIGESEEVRSFPERFPHLQNPFFDRPIFSPRAEQSSPVSRALDMRNALAHLKDDPNWQSLIKAGIHYYRWASEDPLADVFLSCLGQYPDPGDIHLDYLELIKTRAGYSTINIDVTRAIPKTVPFYPNLNSISRATLSRHHSYSSGWFRPGYFVGDAANFEDLVCCWNLSAAGIPLWFVDPNHMDRYGELMPAWEAMLRDRWPSLGDKGTGHLGVWTRGLDPAPIRDAAAGANWSTIRIDDPLWSGHNIRVPMMYFREANVLGVVSEKGDRTALSFSLSNKPFNSTIAFHDQCLVASLSFSGSAGATENRTYSLPYVPEMNVLLGYEMLYRPDKFRVEPQRIGIIIDVMDHDIILQAMPVERIVREILSGAKYSSQVSNAGLIARQLIRHTGGLDGCRVFKIPGVRRLLRSFGLNESITKNVALQKIGEKDPDRPDASFREFETMYIERRQRGTKLTADAVFGYLVEKGLYRIGAKLTCPSCELASWMSLDALSHQVVCDLCGYQYDATRQLADMNEWHYRRSGILGAEKHVQGSVPVTLTLQMLDANLGSFFGEGLYTTSLDLWTAGAERKAEVELDFVWIIPDRRSKPPAILLGECKDQGPITVDEMRKLAAVADAIPQDRFDVFIVLSQIAPFTPDEIAGARAIGGGHRNRVIMLSASELEPMIVGGTPREKGQPVFRAGSPESLASSTAQRYFSGANGSSAAGGGD